MGTGWGICLGDMPPEGAVFVLTFFLADEDYDVSNERNKKKRQGNDEAKRETR